MMTSHKSPEKIRVPDDIEFLGAFKAYALNAEIIYTVRSVRKSLCFCGTK